MHRGRPLVVAALLLTFSTFWSPNTQAAGQLPDQDAGNSGDVVQLGVTLVQLDAVVTDKKGNPVTDLGPDDFEVLQDGKPQRVTYLSYVDTTTRSIRNEAASSSAPPLGRLRPEQVRRTVAIVFDDLHLAAENVPAVKWAIREFVDKQLEAGDLVAIIRTSQSVGALQQFTSDRRVLYDAIDHLHWSPRSALGASSFDVDPLFDVAGIGPTATEHADKAAETPGQRHARERKAEREQGRRRFEKTLAEGRTTRARAFAGGTLGAVSFVLQGMQALPGRKSMVFFSGGWPLLDNDGVPLPGITEQLQTVADLANRSSVSIFTSDVRGLVVPGFFDPAVQSLEQVTERALAYRDTQDPLRRLAADTGGTFQASNDYGKQLRRAVDELRGYYLIGYIPATDTFGAGEEARFNKIDVRVKRPGLQVRARAGFYNVTDAETEARKTAADRMAEAITSPFVAPDVRLDLTPQFLSDVNEGSFVRAYVRVDVRDLTFTERPDGTRIAPIELLGVLFGQNGNVVSKASASHTFVVRDADFERARKQGFVYALNLPISHSGVYQLRTAIRDVSANRFGSAQEIVEVPNLKENEFSLSGALLGATNAGGAQPEMAAHRFAPGTEIEYAFAVYNATATGTPPRPSLELEIALWRDGKRIVEEPARPMELASQATWERINLVGGLRLSPRMQPGAYVLQLTVTDRAARQKQPVVATQWVEFDVADPNAAE